MKHGVTGTVALLLLAGASGCHRHKPQPGEAPAEVCTVEHHGKTVSTSGYLTQPYFSIECKENCYLWVSPKKGGSDGVYAKLTAGPNRNQVRPIKERGNLLGAGAERLEDSEFHIEDAGGKMVGIDDAVRVTGPLAVTREADKLDCRMEVARIESVD